MTWPGATRWIRNRYVVAVAIIVAAAALRLWPLQALGTRMAWLTFYPAALAAAIYGGFWVGLLAAGLACLANLFFWPLFSAEPIIRDSVDWLGMAVFFFNCALISGVAEAMRRAQKQAKLAQEKAEVANRAKSMFLANMSHELRTPLNAILGFSKLMQAEASMSAEQRRTLDIINRSGEHLLGLINNVLDMAKIESGRTAVENSVFDLRAMMRDIADLLRQRAESKGLQLTLEMAQELPRVIVADEGKLRQVVLNLAGNAVKFTSQGGVTLRLASLPLKESQRLKLVIEVEDTGDGIAAEDQQRIFEPFVQIGHKSDQKGTGLGLTITRQFVELMGGVIRVESEPGKGSKFFVELPVEPAEASAVVLAGVKKARLARLAPGQPDCRVLIVEDQAENWQLLSQLLEQAGFQVRVAENGAVGVETFQSWRPQFIWMDWRMPVMDGLEATRRIRALDGGRDVKIVALSASVFKEEREQVLAAGADDFVPKPIQFGRIYDCLTKHLGVRFVSVESPAPVTREPSAELDREALAALPMGLRNELADGLVSLDTARIGGLIRRVAELNAGLGGALGHHADQFQYTIILQALQSCCSGVVKEEAVV